MKEIINNEKGQVLVESIIAITIGVVALSGVLSLLTNAIGVNRDVSQRFTATYLAMEGLEVTKSIIDSNYAQNNPWNQGLSFGSYEFQYNTTNPATSRISSNPSDRSNNPLYFNTSDKLYTYNPSGSVESPFTRTIQILSGSEPSAEEMKVRAVVEWTERGGNDREIVVEDHFFNWRP